jgi:4-hydroxy-3-methylbut-2-enyl diphosphate reductase
MKILRAEHLGMCFGVRDAIALALEQSTEQPLTILGDLVHNETVVARLRARGIRVAQQPAEAATPAVLITAHGASDKARAAAAAGGRRVLEATCPLVHLAHRALGRLVAEGFHPVVIGQRGHVEVRGLTEDYAEFDVVLSEDDVAQLRERPRFGVVAQTTQPIERTRHLVARLRQRFPRSEVRFVDTVCQPTKLRQHAAVTLARRCDVVIVIGGVASNNTRELAATCQQHCARVHHVQTAADLRAEWFFPTDRVGVTAGTSTPDEVIDGVEHWLRVLAMRHEPARPPDRPSSAVLCKPETNLI